MKQHTEQSFCKMLLCLILTVWVTGCDGGGDGADAQNPSTDSPGVTRPSAKMQSFETDAGLEAYLKKQYAEGVMHQDAAYRDDVLMEPEATDSAGDASDNAPGDSGGYSKTNVQEEGVDESDVVKTDGVYMYVAGGREVRIVKAVPGNAMHALGEIELNGRADSLYLYNNILVILYTPDGGEGAMWGGTSMPPADDIGLPYWIPVQAYTGVIFVDVSDPADPIELSRVKAEGYLVSSRLAGGRLHVVQQFLPNLPPLRIWHDGTEADKDAAVSENQQVLEKLSLDDLIPSCAITDADGNTEKRYLVESEDFYFPDNPEGGGNVTVMTFDMDDPGKPFQSIGVAASAETVYASTRALYIASVQWPHYFGVLETGAASDGTTKDDVENVETTSIHKFDLTGGKVRAAGGGSVKGRILNQFSLGEYNDVLRIATTTGGFWWGAPPDTQNHIFCLKETAGGLDVVGSIENLAPGEQIYSARFIGDRGYLVTFVQIDPLFTLDLSNPENPVVVGELKIPGYSEYIHPLSEDYLLTIGKDAVSDADGAWYQGLQLSIFDIRDFADPVRIHHEIIGDRGTHSEALYNHKAFSFRPANNLLAIPVDLYQHKTPPAYPSDYADYVSSGLYVYRVTPENGFEKVGSVKTSTDDNFHYLYRSWTRGVFIDDAVYAATPNFIKTAPLNDMQNPRTLVFEEIEGEHPEEYIDDEIAISEERPDETI